MSVIAIEGIDRLGKGSLIQGIIKEHGYHHIIHYTKPVQTKVNRDLYDYQYQSFKAGFDLLENNDHRFIFDRWTLGEVVYSPRYREYDGNYVFHLENINLRLLSRMWLILLYTDNFDLLKDDGNSFDYGRRQEEMSDFIAAFNESKVPNKKMINVHDGYGDYKRFDVILFEALTFLKETSYANLLSSSNAQESY